MIQFIFHFNLYILLLNYSFWIIKNQKRRYVCEYIFPGSLTNVNEWVYS